MNAVIITIGKEILIGQITDTNSAYIGQKLTEAGIDPVRVISIPDEQEAIIESFSEAGKFGKIILVTGGLGPTSDDVTKPALCHFFQTELQLHKPTLKHITSLLAKRGMRVNEKNTNQALLPAAARVVPNRLGTAPALWFEKNDRIYVCMPGVPYEMKTILTEHVLPEFQKRFSLPAIVHRTILTQGLPESYIATLLEDFEKQLPSDISLAYLPSYGGVRLRLSISGKDEAETQNRITSVTEKLIKYIQPWVYGFDEETLPQVIGRLLLNRKATVVTAESCTGGAVAAAITSVPGSSAYYQGSVVAYSNSIKQRELGVPESSLQLYGAVSEQVVKAMVKGILNKTGADYAIATTGIAGPDGGSPDKPVGTIWIAVGDKDFCITRKFLFGEHRDRNIYRTVQTALNMLRMFLVGIDIQKAFDALP